MSRRSTTADVAGVWWLGNEGPDRYRFADLFGNERPVELDIGCGKGLFLFNQSQLRPHVNFLGIDWSRQYSRMAAARLVRRGIPNARIICASAWDLFNRFEDRSLAAIHIYFPDPWWKTKHRKRRMVRPELLPHVHRLLSLDGTLSLATDVEAYFRVMQKVVATSPYLAPLPPPEPSSAESELDYLTHFERKYRKQGREVYRAQFRFEAP